MAVYGVLLPLPFDDVFDYTAEEELVLGQLVEVPFGREELVGVVWKKGQSANIDPKKIKQIKSVVQLPRLTAEMTAFIRKTAEYNLAPLGMVLKMVLGMKSNQLPKQKVTLYGLKIKNENLDGIRITEARKAVFDFLAGGLEAEKLFQRSLRHIRMHFFTVTVHSHWLRWKFLWNAWTQPVFQRIRFMAARAADFFIKKTYLSTKKPKNKKST